VNCATTLHDLKRHSIRRHAQKNVGSQDILIKEAQKDQMFVSVENITVFE
jgi:hypothetical protein